MENILVEYELITLSILRRYMDWYKYVVTTFMGCIFNPSNIVKLIMKKNVIVA